MTSLAKPLAARFWSFRVIEPPATFLNGMINRQNPNEPNNRQSLPDGYDCFDQKYTNPWDLLCPMPVVRANDVRFDLSTRHHRKLSSLIALMAVPPHHFDDEPSDTPPGGLLGELERRQEDVLSQLDDLDAKLSDVLKGLEPAQDQGIQGDGKVERNAGKLSEDVGNLREDDDDFEEELSLEDWA